MSEQLIVNLLSDMFRLAILLSGPLLTVALVVGVVVSVIQVVTSIQDATLSFVPRMILVIVVGVALLPWMIHQMSTFTVRLFSEFTVFIR